MTVQKKLGSSLPKIVVPLKGELMVGVGTISVGIQEIIDVHDEFNLKWRGPLMASFLAIETRLNSILVDFYLAINSIEFDNYESNIVATIKHKIIFEKNLDKKIKLLFQYTKIINNEFMLNKTPLHELDQVINPLKKDFKEYRVNRNIIAHGYIKPKVNSEKKVIDVYLLHTEKTGTNQFREVEKQITSDFRDNLLISIEKVSIHLNNLNKLVGKQ